MAEPDDADEALRGAVGELLAGGPVPVTDLLGPLDRLGRLDYLRDEGVTEDELADAVVEDVLLTDSIWATTEGVMALIEPLLDGLVLTHRLTADDCRRGEVPATPDLVILDWDEDDGLALAGGGRLVNRMSRRFVPGTDGSAFVGPVGWLDGFAAGDLVAFTRDGAVVRVERAAEAGDDALEVGLLGEAADKRIPPGSGDEAVPMLLDALVADAAAFRRPVRPVEELLLAAGLERRGFSFGRAGERWTSFGEEAHERRHQALAEAWGFSECCHAACDLVTRALAGFDADGAEPDPSAVAGALRHGTVALAFAEEVLGSSDEGDEGLRRFLGAILVGAPPKRSVAPLLVLAMEAERRGDAAGAEEALRRALRADPGYGLAAGQLADYEIDRGDVDRALALLHHPDLHPDRQAIRLLEHLRSDLDARRRATGRNDRCPCGSGRKFKVCCQRGTRLPLSSRLGLLLTKLDRFGRRPHRCHVLVDAVLLAGEPIEADFIAEAMADDPIVADFAAFEGGIAASYLGERGHLLPPDERELLHAMSAEPRRLWEVTAAVPGANLTLRDHATGAELVVEEDVASIGRERGALLLSRVAEVEGGHLLFGAAIEIPPGRRASAVRLVMAEPDVDDLARWYGEEVALATREPPAVTTASPESTLPSPG